ncbi:hypothetical protein Scinn_15110 [Streptomyces virginiae]|uniref:SbsA Ig-like domain-containing protein n=1 Tax=Streptomyces virginiae TaxID=1961 RepID=A0ABQ3NH01_STRVG|nr:DUF4082 domain-containing protein [Streptomyces virginiae]GHI12048.1 hypothetical protein Scinn_15110 [Streptomyces virginiae]
MDAVLDTSGASTTPPTVTGTSPQSAATGTQITAAVTATFSTAVDAETLTFTVKDAGGATVPGTKVLGASNSATFTPSSELALNTTYTASVQVSDLWGNAMTAPVAWNFTTSASPPAVNCPCTLWNGTATPSTANVGDDANSVELGTRFQSAVNGYITGVTFYKGPGNTGTHTGSLWSASGTLLATGTFGSETLSGWQQLQFATPVPITAGTTYVASYHAPNGNYSVDGGYFSGAHRSYPLVARPTRPGAPTGSTSTAQPPSSRRTPTVR